MKIRSAMYIDEAAYAELRLANGYRAAAKAATQFGANKHLIGLYREWMRSHALTAVRMAKRAKVA